MLLDTRYRDALSTHVAPVWTLGAAYDVPPFARVTLGRAGQMCEFANITGDNNSCVIDAVNVALPLGSYGSLAQIITAVNGQLVTGGSAVVLSVDPLTGIMTLGANGVGAYDIAGDLTQWLQFADGNGLTHTSAAPAAIFSDAVGIRCPELYAATVSNERAHFGGGALVADLVAVVPLPSASATYTNNIPEQSFTLATHWRGTTITMSVVHPDGTAPPIMRPWSISMVAEW